MKSIGHPRFVAAVVVVVVVSGSGSACVNFDIEEQFVDTRILASRTTPAELLFSPLFLLPASQRPPIPIADVEVEVELFAFDRRGGDVTVTTQLCPEGAGDASCRLYDKDFDDDFARLVEPTKSQVAALLEPVVVEGTIDADSRAVGRVTPSTFSYTITPGAIDFFQPKDSAGENVPSIFPLLPRVAFEVENTTQRDAGEEVFQERAFKRLPLSIDLGDPSLPLSFKNTLANNLGITLCDGPIPGDDEVADADFEGQATCLHPRGPNVNPAVIGFRIESTTDPKLLTQGTLEGEPDLRNGSLLRVSPGGSISLTPMWAPGAVERYQVISFDIDTSTITVLNRVEDMACNWYASRGLPSPALTSIEYTQERLGMVWSFPADARSGERDSLALVVQDQRGGTTVFTVNVEYR